MAVCHNLPIGNHHAVQAGSRSGGGGKYLWPFVCYWRGFHLFPNERPTHTKQTNAREDADEAQYCRGARHARKARMADGGRGMRARVLLEITYRNALSLSDYFETPMK